MATRWGKRYIDKAAPRHEVMATETRVIQQIVATEEGIVVSESNIGDDAVSNAKLANMAQATFKMRAAGAGTGDPIDGTPSQAKTALGIATAQTYTQTYATADRTHANPTASTLTDSTGATPNTTIENVPAATGDAGGAATVSAAADVATVASVNTALTAIENSLSDLADQINKLIADHADTKQLLNAVIDDLQTAGIVS